uniref:Cyclin-dependent kinase 1 (inferred by orthology to a human protein) n=1 Tax=Strongyloides venezuelensis TaxID=75913 RepID=A0A0K0FPH2_STRVS
MVVSKRLKVTLNDLVKLEKIGEGTYGVVYKYRHMPTGRIVAVKRIKMDIDDEGVPPSSIREIAMLREVRHPNIVSLEDFILMPRKLYLIFEYLYLDLKIYMDRIPEGQVMEPDTVKSFLYQICQGICFCHQRRVLHRDLKPQNLLIDSGGCVKLADFGLSRTVGVPVAVYTHEIVTLWYRSPEILLGADKYSTAVDVWSIACIFGEMATGSILFGGDSEIDQLYKIFQTLGTPSEETWPDIVNLQDYKPTFPKWRSRNIKQRFVDYLDEEGILLLQDMLIYDPQNRANVKDILKHNFFNDLDKKKLPCGDYNGDIFIEDTE